MCPHVGALAYTDLKNLPYDPLLSFRLYKARSLTYDRHLHPRATVQTPVRVSDHDAPVPGPTDTV